MYGLCHDEINRSVECNTRVAAVEAGSQKTDHTVAAADEYVCGLDRPAEKQVVGVRKAGPAINVSYRQRNTNLASIADKAKCRYPSRRHLDLSSRPKMCDRQHMDAAQDFLMQYRGFAAFNGIFIRFASQSTPLRARLHDAPIYPGFQSKEHCLHRDGKCDRGLNAFSFIVAENALCHYGRKAAVDFDVESRGDKGNGTACLGRECPCDKGSERINRACRGDRGHGRAP